MSRRDYEFEDFCGEYGSEYPQDNYVFNKCKKHKNKNVRKSTLDCDDSWPEDDYNRDEIKSEGVCSYDFTL